MAVLNINTFEGNKLTVSFLTNFPLDLGSPGVFISSYKRMLKNNKKSNNKPSFNIPLLNNTKRHYSKYFEAKKALLKLEILSSKSFLGKFKYQRKIRKAQIALSEIKATLVSWVASTILFFSI